MVFSVGRDLGKGPALGNEAAAMFVVDTTEPEFAIVEVALVSGGVAGGIFLRADLNAGVGGGAAGDAVGEGEVEIGDFAFPEEKFVFGERFPFLDGGGDGFVFDTPDFGRTLPLIEALAVEEALRLACQSQAGKE